MKPPKLYRDFPYFLGGTIIVTLACTLIGTDHSIQELLHDPIVPKKLLYNWLFVGLCWWVIRATVLAFDLRQPWPTAHKSRRWALQLLVSGAIISLLFVIDLEMRVYFIPDWKYYPKTVWLTDYPLALIFLFLINMLYYYLWSWQIAPAIAIKPNSTLAAAAKQSSAIQVRKGRQTHLVPSTDIAYAYRKNEINYLLTKEGERYMLDCSINQLENRLANQAFFRLNRQLLVQRRSVLSFQTLRTRHLEVILQPEFPANAIVNKNKAAAFKRWVTTGA
ncbi:MAG: LytTR family DNA-binding domain-containing protein [Bacteroidota bacterium]